MGFALSWSISGFRCSSNEHFKDPHKLARVVHPTIGGEDLSQHGLQKVMPTACCTYTCCVVNVVMFYIYIVFH